MAEYSGTALRVRSEEEGGLSQLQESGWLAAQGGRSLGLLGLRAASSRPPPQHPLPTSSGGAQGQPFLRLPFWFLQTPRVSLIP